METVDEHYMQLLCENTASFLAKTHGLNKKEQRLLAYFLNDSNSPIIGDICRTLKTTVWTLLSKTQPELLRKIGKPGSEEWDRNIKNALDSGAMPEIVTRKFINFP